jgi:hypothetical protein
MEEAVGMASTCVAVVVIETMIASSSHVGAVVGSGRATVGTAGVGLDV